MQNSAHRLIPKSLIQGTLIQKTLIQKTRAFTRRIPLAPWLALATLAILLQVVPAKAQCIPELPAEDVVVRVRTSPPSSTITRREHVRITPALAQALCITASEVRSDGNRSPQVRVEVTSDPTGGGSLQSTALFTVTSITGAPLPSADRVIEVWDRSSSGDATNGLLKLFPNAASASTINTANPAAEARLYGIAPATTTEVEFHLAGRLNPIATVHYNDPNNDSNHFFEEYFEMGDDHRLAVVVPHGGDIEPGISDNLWRVPLGLDTYTRTVADVWEGVGDWGDVGETGRRWHITAADLSARAFPGLAQLLNQAAVEPYDYAVAIHGFSENAKAFIIGGQADKEEKCYLANQILNRLGTRRDEVAVTVFYSQNGTRSLNVADPAGHTFGSRTDLKAFESDNVVNRLSPNPSFLPTFGGFQIEASRGLRDDDELMRGLLSGLGNGLGRLHTYPPGALGACSELTAP